MYARLVSVVGKSKRFSIADAWNARHEGSAEIAEKTLKAVAKAVRCRKSGQVNGKEVDVAITMGCGDECPLVLARRREDWNIPDPKNMTPDQFREVRDLIERMVKKLLDSL